MWHGIETTTANYLWTYLLSLACLWCHSHDCLFYYFNALSLSILGAELKYIIQFTFENNWLCHLNTSTGAFKADLFRYCVLLIRGGVYADMDVLLQTNLDNAVADDIGFMTPIDNVRYTIGMIRI